MSKVHYLNSHVEKFREDNQIIIDVENIGDLTHYCNLHVENKKVTKIFTKCFQNKETYKELLDKLPDNVDRLGRFYLITVYWLCFINYYYYDTFGDEINKCLENTEQEQVLLKSPHFCKKIYHYLMKPEII